MSKKILLSLAALAVIAIAGTYGTIAFFSDKEASRDNTFTAGSVDLKVSDELVEVHGPTGSVEGWVATDLTTEKFFNFTDMKPGDWGQDTIDLSVQTNEAYVCARIKVTETSENLIINPEKKAGDETADAGELQKYLHFYSWLDKNCNGTQEEGESTITTYEDVLTGIIKINVGAVKPGIENKTCISKKWCFGDWKRTEGGMICDGSGDQNDAQTDGLKADVQFYAVQTRHNENFSCESVMWDPTI